MNQRLDQIRMVVAFLTRLPIAGPGEADRAALARAAWAFPLAGLLVATLAAAVFGASASLGLSPWLSGTLAILTQMLLTGALHEDGLADSADGLGGRDVASRLAIMRDSRTGSYGVLALAVSLMIRAGALAALGDPVVAATALLAGGTMSRAALCLPMRLLPMARMDGLSVFAGRPTWSVTGTAWLLAVVLCLPGLGIGLLSVVFAGVLIAAFAVSALAHRRLGGQTGDILGATQQVTECVCLLLLCASL